MSRHAAAAGVQQDTRKQLSEAMLNISLFVSHDNESRQEKAMKGMTCMIETALGDDSNSKSRKKSIIILLACLKAKGERDDDTKAR